MRVLTYFVCAGMSFAALLVAQSIAGFEVAVLAGLANLTVLVITNDSAKK